MSGKNKVYIESVNHPEHYGGEDNPYEAIKVIEHWNLGFNLGNLVKYISRAGKKDPTKKLEDLMKAKFYLDREIQNLGKIEKDLSGGELNIYREDIKRSFSKLF